MAAYRARKAALDRVVVTGAERGGITRQKCHHRGHFLGAAETAERVQFGEAPPLHFRDVPVDEPGVDEAGADPRASIARISYRRQ